MHLNLKLLKKKKKSIKYLPPLGANAFLKKKHFGNNIFQTYPFTLGLDIVYVNFALSESRSYGLLQIERTSLNYPHLPPDVALWLSLSGSNYPRLEQISMVPKMFEPFQFDRI